MEDRVNFATILNPITDFMGVAAPQSSWKIGKELRQNPKAVIDGRLAAVKFLSNMSEKSGDQNRKWVARLPEGSPSKAMNFALIHILCMHFAYPGKSLPGDLAKGMLVVGPVPDSGVFRKRVRPASTTLPDWREGLLARNLLTVERASQGAGAMEARLCWEKTMREVTKSWATQPVPAPGAILNDTPLPRRFAIEEERGGQGTRIRVIDDFEASRVNDLLSVDDAAAPQNLDVFFGMASMFAQLGCARPLKACVMDFAQAYKHVGIPPAQLDFATIVLPGLSGTPTAASLRTQPL